MTDVFITDTKRGVETATSEMFAHLESTGPVLKGSKVAYVKVNGIDFKKHCHTTPAVLEHVILNLKKYGAEKIFVMENSTQANMTRVVFAIAGFSDVCRRTGAVPVYLDEERTNTFEFRGMPVADEPEKGYMQKEFRLPATVVKIMENRDGITYVNVPKLKTHSMAGVTLGMKNQWGFPQHADRGMDHNHNLHSKIADVYEYIRPDYTIIDGIEGTVNGHYPPSALADRVVKKFDVLIGGRDTVAVDVVGARIFGLGLEDVPHLKIAHGRGLGEGDLTKIAVHGRDLNEYSVKYGTDLLQEFPPDVMIVKGRELLCREGCQNNPLAVLQVFWLDHGGRGGFFLVMGKGFDGDIVDRLRSAGMNRGLVAGDCAINEVGGKLRSAFGRRNVYYSGTCNRLADTVTALSRLMDVSPFKLVPIPAYRLLLLALQAKLHGSTALIPRLF